MNTELETLLHSWKPRRPSPKVEARLFAWTSHPRPETNRRVNWAWCAPTLGFAASLALTVLTFTNAPPGGSSPAQKGRAAALETDSNNNRNLWQRASFEWTKRSVSNSTVPSSVAPGTNSLMN